MRTSHLSICSLSLFLASGLPCTIAAAQDWTGRFPPDADCRLTVRSAVNNRPDSDRTATVVVRPVRFGRHIRLGNVLIGLAPLGQENPASKGRAWSPDTTGVQVFTGLPEGRYSLVVRGMYGSRTDTIEVRPGQADTILAPLEGFYEAFRNVHNCRPRGFRRAGESACALEGFPARGELDYARDLARPERGSGLRLPPLDTARISLVGDEATCERAGRAYGESDDPPRRVVVIQMDSLYLVYDPFEPLACGEWDVHRIFDRSWQVVVSLAS